VVIVKVKAGLNCSIAAFMSQDSSPARLAVFYGGLII